MKTQKITKYHYTECGLDHVYIHGINIEDDNQNSCIQLVALGLLHRLISLELIKKINQLNNKEIFFLRYELSLTRKQLAGKIDTSVNQIKSCEADSNTKLDIDTENKLRNLVFESIRDRMIRPILEDKELWHKLTTAINDHQYPQDINIKTTDNDNSPYTTVKAA